MALQYRIDVLAALKAAGYNTAKLRKEKLLSESTIQKFRDKLPVSWENLETLCKLLNMQIGDIVEYVPDEAENV